MKVLAISSFVLVMILVLGVEHSFSFPILAFGFCLRHRRGCFGPIVVDKRNTIATTSLWSTPRKDSSSSSNNNNNNNNDDDDHERMLESLGLDPRNNDALLEYSIDSFLRGDYDRSFADDAAAPLPGLTPGATIDAALRSLRQLDDPEPSHGAAVLLRFCAPLSRGERWGGSPSSGRDQWKELLRGALTPTMLARRIRASEEFSGLLDWTKLDVTEGTTGKKDIVGVPSVAYVNVALYFEDGMEPTIFQFKLSRVGGVFLIDSAKRSNKNLFMEKDE